MPNRELVQIPNFGYQSIGPRSPPPRRQGAAAGDQEVGPWQRLLARIGRESCCIALSLSPLADRQSMVDGSLCKPEVIVCDATRFENGFGLR